METTTALTATSAPFVYGNHWVVCTRTAQGFQHHRLGTTFAIHSLSEAVEAAAGRGIETPCAQTESVV